MRFLLKMILVSAAVAAMLASTGCGKKQASTVQVTQELRRNFKGAEPQAQQAVAQAAAAINAAAASADIGARRTQYIQAMQPLATVVGQGNLSKEQVKAVHQVFLQVHRAAQQNPTLNNKDFYQAQAALANQLYRAGVRP